MDLARTAFLLFVGCSAAARPPSPPAPCGNTRHIILDEVMSTTAFLDSRAAPVMWVSPETGEVEVVMAEAAKGGGALRSRVWTSEAPGRWRARGQHLDFAQEPVAIAGDWLAVGQFGYRDRPELDVRIYRYVRALWREVDRLPHVSVSSPGLGIDDDGNVSGLFGDDQGRGELWHRDPDGVITPIDDLGDLPGLAVTPRALVFVDDAALWYREPPAAAEVVDPDPRRIDAVVIGEGALAIRGEGAIVALGLR